MKMKSKMKSLVGILILVPTLHAKDEPLNFSRDIRPILSAKCFSCHGPDTEERDADYRLDTKDGAFADLGGYFGIVPGKPEDSEVVYRITTDDLDDLMPPPKHKNPLTKEEASLLVRWVKEGAPYADHWAFEPVQRPPLPKTKAKADNAIDHFVAARLEQEGLAFSPEAAPETLVRRLYLDLTGLPPDVKAVDAFLQDPQGQYLPTIERLMQTPQFAERLAMEWLDVARFADTNGYSIDDHRDMWGWRDWVIHAFQNNLPYDEFIRQQLAGDLLPKATELQKIATGFLRNSMNTHEGGTIAEEYRVARIADQIDTVSTAFMGLTMKCSQCHDHKYDPIPQEDYYRFFAFFNTSSEPGKGATNGNTKPFLAVSPILHKPDAFKQALEDRIVALEDLKDNPGAAMSGSYSQWEADTLSKAPPATSGKSAGPFPFPKGDQAKGLSWIWANKAGSGQFAWFRKSFSLQTLPKSAQLFISCDNEADVWLNGKKIGRNQDWREPSILNLRPHLKEGDNILAIRGKDWQATGGKAALFALAAFSDGTYLRTDASWQVADKELAGWKGSQAPEGFRSASVMANHGTAPWGNTFTRIKQGSSNLIQALRKPRHQRTPEDRKQIINAFSKAYPDMGKFVKAIDGEIGLIKKSLKSGKTTVMVMDMAAASRKTPILIRGQYNQHGKTVKAGIPSLFGDSDAETPDRLALANWLTDPKHPLTARVTVNRYWQLLFGTGIVKTAEDFGSQGEWPSHPELLDWLATEFVASGWDVRKLLKTMLLSRTYRQTSNVSQALQQKDPYNRLLARAPRFRLHAESIRDTALSIGGLLNPKLGGPSVYPPQPGGLWKEVSHFGYPGFFSAQHFFPDQGEPIFRRSMYTFWKRTSPPPVMMAFDAPNRETCLVRRSRTNTPLQALVLMNEPQFVEASRGLAKRMMVTGNNIDDQIRHGFRLATSRQPSKAELQILQNAYTRQVDYFKADPQRIGSYLGPNADPESAALTSVASLLLNLDETITRE